MSKPGPKRNRGRYAFEAAHKRLAELDAQLQEQISLMDAMDAEATELRAFIELCEQYDPINTEPASPECSAASSLSEDAQAEADSPEAASAADSMGRRGSGAEPLPELAADAKGDGDHLTSRTAHQPQPGDGPTCREVVAGNGGTDGQDPDCGRPDPETGATSAEQSSREGEPSTAVATTSLPTPGLASAEPGGSLAMPDFLKR